MILQDVEILVVYPHKASDALKSFAHNTISFADLVSDVRDDVINSYFFLGGGGGRIEIPKKKGWGGRKLHGYKDLQLKLFLFNQFEMEAYTSTLGLLIYSLTDLSA